MGFLKKLGKGLKKGFKKLGSNIKKHGPGILKTVAGVGLASMIPGVGGLLGKALGTGGSGFMGGLFKEGGLKAAAKHLGGKFVKGQVKGLLGKALSGGGQIPQGMPMMPQVMGSMMPMTGLLGQAVQQGPVQQAPASPQMPIPYMMPQQALETGQLAGHEYL
jgi:hypothetical protein